MKVVFMEDLFLRSCGPEFKSYESVRRVLFSLKDWLALAFLANVGCCAFVLLKFCVQLCLLHLEWLAKREKKKERKVCAFFLFTAPSDF